MPDYEDAVPQDCRDQGGAEAGLTARRRLTEAAVSYIACVWSLDLHGLGSGHGALLWFVVARIHNSADCGSVPRQTSPESVSSSVQ